MTFEPSAYLQRIGLDDPPSVDREGLAIVHRAHQGSVPFESFDVLARRPMRLDTTWLADKIIRRRRGGFCYELNYLFAELLTALGFRVSLASAGVYAHDGKPGPPFDHLTLIVDFDGDPFLCDVGFGRAFLQPIPLRVNPHIEDPVGIFALEHSDRSEGGFGDENGVWRLLRFQPEDARARSDGWVPLYRFDRTSRRIDEFAAMFKYHRHSPESFFHDRVVATRATSEGRVSVLENDWFETTGEIKSTGHFADDEERRRFLIDRFGLDPETLA